MATLPPNTSWIIVSGSGTAECDGLYKPSTAPPTVSESGTASSIGYWNGKMAWDRADGNAKRNPSISYSGSYKAWRIARLDGHLAYTIVNDDDMPTTTEPWDVYKKGVAPPPTICIFATEQEARATWTGVGFEKRSPGETKTVVAAATSGGDNRILGQILALVPKLQQPELNQLQSILAGTANGGASTSKKPNVVFVLGGPGAGKGTMCTLASEQLGWSHLSAGDLLRAERTSGGANADLINEYIKEGKIVPVEITVNLIKTAMSVIARETGNVNFLIDGFPRSLDNYEGWKRVMGDFATVHCTLFFECPLSVLEERILGRAKYVVFCVLCLF